MSFLNPDPEKVFYSIPGTCVSLCGRRLCCSSSLSWVSEEQVQCCPHGSNHLPLELLKNILGIAEGFDLHFEKEQDLSHRIYLQAQGKALAGGSRIIPGSRARLQG